MNVFSSDAWEFAVDVEWVENVIKKSKTCLEHKGKSFVGG